MKKILFIYPAKSTFIASDIDILKKHFSVTEQTGDWSNKFKLPFLMIWQFFYLLFRVHTFDFIVISFGGYWSLVPSFLGKLTKKSVYIILHGTDCVSFKDLNYGNLRKPYLKKIIGLSYKFATKLLPVSKSLIYTENTYYSDKIIKQGIQYHFPNLETPTQVVPNVFDSEKWFIKLDCIRKKNKFVTVMGQNQFYLKGGDLILKVANKFPNLEFEFIGLEAPKLEIPNNVRFLGRKTPQELLNYFNESAYYLQLSISEGFGCALCEAMLCGCIPIVSNVNILPDIVGDSGYVLKKPNEFYALLQNLAYDQNRSKLARNQIIENYDLKLRERTFLNLI